MHDFCRKLAQGEAAEAFLDRLFAQWNEITPATPVEQRRGIDRWFTSRAAGRRRSVEYKTDWRAHETGNAFVETISVDTRDKPGWAYTSEALWLVYYLPGGDLVYCVRMLALRRMLPTWLQQYPVRAAKNDGYLTHGVCVPLAEFERRASAVINLADVPDIESLRPLNPEDSPEPPEIH